MSLPTSCSPAFVPTTLPRPPRAVASEPSQPTRTRSRFARPGAVAQQPESPRSGTPAMPPGSARLQ